jgi:phage shock protein A
MAPGSVIRQILARVSELLQPNTESGRSPGDDPVSALGRLIGRMTEQLIEAKSHLDLCRAQESRLNRQVEVAEGAALAWERRAMAAVRAGDDVIARDALVKKRAHDLEADDFRSLLRHQRRDIEHLRQALTNLNHRIELTKNERDATLLRQQRAGANEGAPEEHPRMSSTGLVHPTFAIEGDAALPPELAEGAIEPGAATEERMLHAEADLLRMKQALAKGKLPAQKPLAKTLPGAQEKSQAPRSTGPETGIRRTKH